MIPCEPLPDDPEMQGRRAAAACTYRRRKRSVAVLFVALTAISALFGAAGLEGINVLRAYAAAESHWSKAEKSAVIAIDRYLVTRDRADYAAFQTAVAVIASDRDAREFAVGKSRDFARAGQSFRGGGNDAEDVRGLLAGVVLFYRLEPFKAAVANWKQGDAWMGALAQIGASIHSRIVSGAAIDTMLEWNRIAALDLKMSASEAAYSQHMNAMSRIALLLTLLLFGTASALACTAGVWFVWRTLRNVRDSELRAIDGEERVRDFAELGTDWYCEFDRDFRVTFVSTRLQEGFAAGVKGLTWPQIVAQRGLSGFGPGEVAILRQHVPFRAQRIDQTVEGAPDQHWSASGMPVFDTNAAFAGYRIAATNITRLIRVQEDLKQARDEAEQGSRAKSAFLANMSHELRTPLNAILGFSEMIERQIVGAIDNARYVGYAHDIGSAGKHLLALINDLLDHSRIEAGQFVLHKEPFRLDDALQAIGLFCRDRAEMLGVTLTIDTAADIPAMLGDGLRFKQVLINLVTNAIKFAPQGDVRVGASLSGNTLRVTVRDTGIGMDAAGIRQALRPFGQVDSGLNRRYEGTGLGLPLAKSLVELQGGTLSVESEPSVGTCVTITLPFVAAVTKAAA